MRVLDWGTLNMGDAVFDLINAESDCSFLFLCDHGGDSFFDSDHLGLSPEQLESDVVCDWGTHGLTRVLSEEMKAFGIISRFSRLVVDLNRYPVHEGCMPVVTQRGFPVPGNQNLSRKDKSDRLDRFFWPYHNAVTQKILDLKKNGVSNPAVISIHSFAPEYHGIVRPWELGVMFSEDERMSAPFIEALKGYETINLGINEPYTVKDDIGFGFSMDYHAVFRGAPHIMLEVRQDELKTPEAIGTMASIIKHGLESALAFPR